MDLTQIAQIKGSLTNFMTLNPSFASSLFSNYADATPWLGGSGVPLAIVTVDTFYFNTDNGDVYLSSVVDGVRSWQYQCNYFNTHTPRIISKEISYTDINGGKAPQPEISLPLPVLNANEIISMAWIVLLENFVSSSVSPSLNIQINEPAYTGTVVDFSVDYFNDTPNVYIMQGFSADLVYGKVIGIEMSNITESDRSLNVIIDSDELTNLSAGKVKLFYKIETLA